ncbi:Peptidase C1 domain containing protein [Trichuris trichiura]|uniref:Peptidase C1 domain containing protein n=1 Tax=Trichuris trichiura TaxID=36087 RepID=A0A077Z4A9_TRITR|nr:Peptidase C1 domain containing protein [Trichuris trichiura]
MRSTTEEYGPIPEVFDARQKWPECDSIGQIRDQSNCGSCWATAAAESISDRICIATKGKQKPTISTADLLACCGSDCGWGCEGAFPYNAWVYWVNHSLVTGGLYNSSSGCKPYPFPPCSHYISGTYPPCKGLQKTPTCTKKCSKTYDAKDYASDKYYGSAAYMISSGERRKQEELMKYGPFEATIAVYQDFLSYKSGIYQHKTGEFVGNHAVRLVGWKIEQHTPYWLLANSWNPEWGEKGFFKLIRGKDSVFIEQECAGGLFGSFDSAS